MTESQRAYCAGLFDGEGTCAAQWYRASKNGKKYLRGMVRIVNTDRRCLDFVKEAFGVGWVGIDHRRKIRGKKRKALYKFQILNATGVRFVIEILPYVTIKKEQIGRMLLALQEYKEKKRMVRNAKGALRLSVVA